MKRRKKAVALFSGGLDSTVCLCWALNEGYECLALTVHYGQKHSRERKSAEKITKLLKTERIEVNLKFPWLAQSSLVGRNLKVPRFKKSAGIPSTYVPGRNLIFASIGASLADAVEAEAVILGANSVDYSGYPDCRPVFYRAFKKAANLGTRKGIEGNPIEILTPLINFSKAQIIKMGLKLGAPLEHTWSCYKGGKKPCGVCDSCVLRAKGFREARMKDPAP